MRVVRLGVLVAVMLLVPGVSAQVGPKAAPAPMLTEAQVRARLLAQPTVEGRIVGLKLGEKLVTVEYVHINKKPPLDPFAAKFAEKKVEFLKNAYDKAVESKFQPLIDKLGEELTKAQKEASGIEEVPVDFILRIDADAKLRNMSPPLDDNGKPKKLTAEEQRALKGGTGLPGYTATEDDLRMDQQVRFTVDKSKYKPSKSAKDTEEKPIYPITSIIILPPPMVAPNENPFTKNLKK
jgi:hypothetical protein